MRTESKVTRVSGVGGLVLATVLVAACAPDPPDGPERTIGVYAAVIKQLVLEDHTYGGESPFEQVYVVDVEMTGAGEPNAERVPAAPLGADVRDQLRAELADQLPPVEFISAPDAARATNVERTYAADDEVVITLAPIEGTGGKVEVPVAMWCGGLCGQQLTYVVEYEDNGWRTTGTTGASSIS